MQKQLGFDGEGKWSRTLLCGFGKIKQNFEIGKLDSCWQLQANRWQLQNYFLNLTNNILNIIKYVEYYMCAKWLQSTGWFSY